MFIKKIIFPIFFVLLFLQNICGQTKSDTLAKSLNGTWRWQSNDSESVTIKLQCYDTMQKSKITDSHFQYIIYGWHRVVQKGTEVENTIQDSGALNKASIIGIIINDSLISLNFHDLTRDRIFRVKLEFTDSEMRSLKWTSFPTERKIYPAPHPKIIDGQTISENIILKKVCS